MSAATPPGGDHRKKARGCLDDAAVALQQIPTGEVGANVMLAHSAKAQVFATGAIAYALLEIGDVLREALKTTTEETSADG